MILSRASAQGLQVRSIAELPELLELEPAWKRLSDTTPDAHLATLYAMVLANAQWSRQEGPWRCYVTSNKEGSIRQGLFGRRITAKIRRIGVRAFIVGTEHVSSFAMAPDTDSGEVRRLIEVILAEQSDCAFIEFSQVNEGELRLLRSAASGTRAMHTWVINDTGHYFDTSIPFPDLFQKFGTRLRRNLRRETKRLNDRYSIEFETLESSCVAQNLEYLERYMDLEECGWKGRNGTDVRSIEADYYRCIVQDGSRSGLIRWYSLLADGKPIAMYLCLRHHATIWAPKTAYDESFARYSPGNHLLLRMLEQLCAEEDIQRLHMITCQPWVTSWKPCEDQYYRFRIFGPSMLGRLMYFADRARGRFGRGTA